MRQHICPVCGYPNLEHAPHDGDFEICPSCGTEFGLDDVEHSHEELRLRWVDAGATWFSETTRKPHGWNAFEQLADAGYLQPKIVTESAPTIVTRAVYGRYKNIPQYKRD